MFSLFLVGLTVNWCRKKVEKEMQRKFVEVSFLLDTLLKWNARKHFLCKIHLIFMKERNEVARSPLSPTIHLNFNNLFILKWTYYDLPLQLIKSEYSLIIIIVKQSVFNILIVSNFLKNALISCNLSSLKLKNGRKRR